MIKIKEEIERIEKANKYAGIFWEYDGWNIDEIIKDLAYSQEEVEEIKQELGEILSYCALYELDRFDFDSISAKYYKTIQNTCEEFSTSRTLDELYEELDISDPYKEKEEEDDYDRYEHEWEREIKSELH